MDIANIFSNTISFISSKFSVGRDMSIAILIGAIILLFLVIGFIFKTLKKKIGTLLTIVLVVIILFGTGILSISQVKDFSDKIEQIQSGETSITEESEGLGDDVIDFFDKYANDTDEENAGSWVPDKDSASAEDW